MGKATINFIAKLYDIKPYTLGRYYLEITSDFAKERDKPGGSIYDGISKKGIIKPENMGEILCIDELDLSGSVYTILSNSEKKNGIIAILPGTKSGPIIRLLKDEIHEAIIKSVKEISCDMSYCMEAIIEGVFPSAKIVTDRFHFMKELLDDLQTIRKRIKTEVKIEENAKRLSAKANGVKYKPEINLIGETKLESLNRIMYQLNIREAERNWTQKYRYNWLSLDLSFEDMVKGHKVIQEMFRIFDNSKTRNEGEKGLQSWITRSKKHSEIREIECMIKTTEIRFVSLVNYFENRHSNGYAEGLNSRIRNLLQMVKGFKNKDYMIYRILKLFS